MKPGSPDDERTHSSVSAPWSGLLADTAGVPTYKCRRHMTTIQPDQTGCGIISDEMTSSRRLEPNRPRCCSRQDCSPQQQTAHCHPHGDNYRRTTLSPRMGRLCIATAIASLDRPRTLFHPDFLSFVKPRTIPTTGELPLLLQSCLTFLGLTPLSFILTFVRVLPSPRSPTALRYSQSLK